MTKINFIEEVLKPKFAQSTFVIEESVVFFEGPDSLCNHTNTRKKTVKEMKFHSGVYSL